MTDSDVYQDVIEWAEGDDKRIRVLNRILEYERDNDPSTTFEERVDKADWEPGSDVSMEPYMIGMLKSAPFINVVFDSRSSTVLALDNFEATEEAVAQLEDEPDEWSQEWLEDQLGSNKIDKVLENIEVTEEDEQEIRDITHDTNALDYWSEYVMPDLQHRELAQKAVLILLASPEDVHGTKGRVNILAYGPPGTGKSMIKKFLVNKFGAESIDGPRVSKADITYNKSTNEFGQLPKAHKGILVVEESDEMDEKPLGASLTSLGESGKIEIRDKEIPAEARGVFLSNFGSVDEAISQWSEESVNRFDFTIEFDRLEEDQRDDAISWHYEYFRKPKPSENEDLFMKYLKVCRAFKPDIKDGKAIQEYKRDNIEAFENVREGISVMNIAWIIARLNLRDVTLEDYRQAYELITQ